jgi:hypothetical protein
MKPADAVTVQVLRRKGVCTLDPLTRVQTDELNEWLLSRPVVRDAHVPQLDRPGHALVPRADAADSECVCVAMGDAVRAPHLLERGMATIDAAEAYLERPPLAYSMNAFWTRPGPAGTRPDIQEFHRDLDDTKFLAMFVYLTDVLTFEDGPHQLRGPDGVERYLYGQAGTVFLADTSHEHRGIKPTSRERGIAWLRWGVSDPPMSYMWDRNEPIHSSWLGDRYPADPRLRRSIRLLVRDQG